MDLENASGGSSGPTISFKTSVFALKGNSTAACTLHSVIPLPSRDISSCLKDSSVVAYQAFSEYWRDKPDVRDDFLAKFKQTNLQSLLQPWTQANTRLARSPINVYFDDCEAEASVTESGSYDVTLTFSGHYWEQGRISTMSRTTFTAAVEVPGENTSWVIGEWTNQPSPPKKVWAWLE